MNLLLTGVTGFLGKVVLLDLLQNHFIDIQKIYLLIRRKKNESAKKRFQKISNNKYLKEFFNHNILKKIIVIESDISLENLGINKNILEGIGPTITHIIHNAASVKFNDPIKIALQHNYNNVENIYNICTKYFTNLKKFIHISTFYVNFPNDQYQEKIIKLNMKYNKIIELIQDNYSLTTINKILNLDFANTYVFTKCLAEKFLEHKLNNDKLFNIHIVRPSIIANAYKFPYPGWVDSFTAYNGFNLSFGTNAIHYLKAIPEKGFDLKNKINIIPVDIVSNKILNLLNNNNDKFITEIAINDKENININKISKSLKYYNIIGYKGNYNQVHDENQFYILNLFFDYIPYRFFYYLSMFISKSQMKRFKLLSENLSNINDLFFYYSHNKWSVQNTPLMNIDSDYYHNIIIPNGNLKFLLNTKLSEYSILNHKNTPNFDLLWIYSKADANNKLRSMTGFILRKVFRNLFSNIYVDIQKIIDIFYRLQKKKIKNIIICPNHRSYCDFLLISYIFFELKLLNINLPKIAATSDFKKIPFIGKLFQELGCFYVERGKGRNQELNNKIQKMINHHENIEIFVEGTRSRSRLLMPFKKGLIKAIQETKNDLFILPLTISYEKIPEQNTFLNELKNGEKTQMSLFNLCSWCLKQFTNKQTHGKVFVNFSEPLKLSANKNPKPTLNNLMRQFQLNTVSTSYHFNYPIKKNFNIKSSGLNDIFFHSTLEKWICMNHWIFRFLKIENCQNIWESSFLKKYDYLLLRDKYNHYDQNKFFHREYFKYLNKDIFNILEFISNKKYINKKEILNDYNLYLGIISIDLCQQILYNDGFLSKENILIKPITNYYKI